MWLLLLHLGFMDKEWSFEMVTRCGKPDRESAFNDRTFSRRLKYEAVHVTIFGGVANEVLAGRDARADGSP